MSFEVLPVVHLERRSFPEYPGADPEDVLTRLARRFGRVAFVDVTGVRTNDADLEFLQTASRRRSLWVDAGSRYATDAMDLFVAGAETVTMRWNTLASSKELEEAAQLTQPGTLHLMMEYPRGLFLRNPKAPWDAREVATFARSLDVGLVFLVDRADASFLNGLPEAPSRFVQGVPRSAIPLLEERGHQGVLLAPTELPPEEGA